LHTFIFVFPVIDGKGEKLLNYKCVFT